MKKPQFNDIHILQTVPPSNINRDDTGRPKTAYFGGVKRSRVSSQAWKKATRDSFSDLLDEFGLGWRTKRAASLIAEAVTAILPDIEDGQAEVAAEKALAATGVKVKGGETGYLLFLSSGQIKALASLAAQAFEAGAAVDKKLAKEILDIKKKPTLNSIDVAMFGRMVADAPDLNVDASVQVAHAIGIGKMNPEFDYFTALDDCSPEDSAGAAMIETTEFTSSTMYRYATIDVLHLCENLGSAAVACRGIEAFLKAFITSMPTGKQNSFANRTLPGAVVLQLRDTQPVSLVNAFEKPVEASHGKSQIEIGCERLAKQEEAIDKAFGTTPQKTFVITASPDAQSLPGAMGVEGACGLDAAIAQISQACAAYLAENGYQTEEVD